MGMRILKHRVLNNKNILISINFKLHFTHLYSRTPEEGRAGPSQQVSHTAQPSQPGSHMAGETQPYEHVAEDGLACGEERGLLIIISII